MKTQNNQLTLLQLFRRMSAPTQPKLESFDTQLAVLRRGRKTNVVQLRSARQRRQRTN